MAKEYNNIVSLTLTERQFKYLKAYCYKHDITYSHALRALVERELQLNELLSNEEKIIY